MVSRAIKTILPVLASSVLIFTGCNGGGHDRLRVLELLFEAIGDLVYYGFYTFLGAVLFGLALVCICIVLKLVLELILNFLARLFCDKKVGSEQPDRQIHKSLENGSLNEQALFRLEQERIRHGHKKSPRDLEQEHNDQADNNEPVKHADKMKAASKASENEEIFYPCPGCNSKLKGKEPGQQVCCACCGVVSRAAATDVSVDRDEGISKGIESTGGITNPTAQASKLESANETSTFKQTELRIIICPTCEIRVIPMGSGKCPSCDSRLTN